MQARTWLAAKMMTFGVQVSMWCFQATWLHRVLRKLSPKSGEGPECHYPVAQLDLVCPRCWIR